MREIIDTRPVSVRINEKFQKFLEKHGLTNEQQEIIKKLKKEDKYDDIFTLFGKEVYLFNTPSKYMKKDIKKLLKEGRFEDIYHKYGASSYNNYLNKMQAVEIYMETHSHTKGMVTKLKNNFVKKILPMTMAGAMTFEFVPLVVFPIMSNHEIKKNAQTYAEEIVSYNARVNDYVKQFEQLELSNLQIIMKVIDDMWNDIKGYGKPSKDILGYERLDFQETGGIGVCRNMADDVAAKLNAINPEYNARPLIVYMTEEVNGQKIDYSFANIKQKLAYTNNHQNAENNVPSLGQNIITEATKLFGNHKVVIMDVPGETYNLIVDPTNPSIGVFVNGEIYTFASTNGQGVSNPYFSQFYTGFEAQANYETARKNSYKQEENIEDLRQKWGIEAENKALEEARQIARLAVQNPMTFTSNNNYTYTKSIEIDSKELGEENVRTR